jgi:hypothetical protein
MRVKTRSPLALCILAQPAREPVKHLILRWFRRRPHAARPTSFAFKPFSDVLVRIFNRSPPQEHQRETNVLAPEQVKRLLNAARGIEEYAYVLAAVCALRISESYGYIANAGS